MKELLDEGQANSGVDFTGATPLHMAGVFGQVKAAEVLLEAGARPNLADRVKTASLKVKKLSQLHPHEPCYSHGQPGDKTDSLVGDQYILTSTLSLHFSVSFRSRCPCFRLSLLPPSLSPH